MSATTEDKLKQIEEWKARGDNEAVISLYEAMLEDQDQQIRFASARAIHAIKGADAIAPLLKALRHKNVATRTASAEALGAFQDVRAVDPLIDVLRREDGETRMVAVDSLGLIGDDRAVRPLIEVMMEGNTSTRGGRRSSRSGTGGHAEGTGTRDLSEEEKSEAWDCQWRVARALGRIGSPTAMGSLIAWGHRVFSTELKKITSQDKVTLVHQVMATYFSVMDEAELRSLTSKIQPTVRMRGWVVSDRGIGSWQTLSTDNPIWLALSGVLDAGKEGIAPASPTAAIGGVPSVGPGGSAEPPPPPVERKVIIELPRPSGTLEAFLHLLKEKELSSVVVVGGALREHVFDQRPEEFDITFLVSLPEGIEHATIDPASWNGEVMKLIRDDIAALTEGLGTNIDDLLEGRTRVDLGGREVTVHYVGPYFEEERRDVRGRYHTEQAFREKLSRLGMVADKMRLRTFSLVSQTTLDEIWMDPDGIWRGQTDLALKHIQDKRVHVDQVRGRPGWMALEHLLRLQRFLAGTLSDNARKVLERSAQAIRDSSDEFAQEFDPAFIDMILGDPPESAGETLGTLDRLGLIKYIAPRMESGPKSRMEEILKKHQAGRAGDIEQARREYDEFKADMEAKKARYESNNAAFFKLSDGLDSVNAMIRDIETELQTQTAALETAEAANKQAAEKLEAASAKIKEGQSSGKPADISLLQEHRKALTAKQKSEQDFNAAQAAVDRLRAQIEQNQTSAAEVQGQMSALGEELEGALKEYQTAQSRFEVAEAAMRKIEDKA